MKKLEVTTPKDIADKIPSELPKPNPQPVDVGPEIDWAKLVKINLGERLALWLKSIGEFVRDTASLVSDVAKITTFLSTSWPLVVGMIVILILLYLLL